VAEEVLAHYKERGLSGMVHMAPAELAGISGVGQAKAATILASVELGRRLSQAAAARIEIVHGPEDAAHYAMPRFRFEQREHFAVLLLNTKNHILGMPEISVGSLSASIVHPREVFREAINYAAASMILLHNHPSGDPSPSREDIAVTNRLVKAGKIMDIEVLDHIILGDHRFLSSEGEGAVVLRCPSYILMQEICIFPLQTPLTCATIRLLFIIAGKNAVAVRQWLS
jgi:DNA repair protein RadC